METPITNPKTKVLYVITKSNFGGAQRYVFDLANGLPKDQFEVVVALGGTGERGTAPGVLREKLEAIGIRTVVVSSFLRNVSLWRDLTTFRELLTLFKRERPAVVHLNSAKAVTIGALAARIARVPRIISTVHGWASNEPRPWWQRRIISFLESVGMALAHTTIVVCAYDRRGDAVVIHNGIDLSMQLDTGDMIRSAFPQGVRITGTIGELTRNKNQVMLIEAARADEGMYVAIVGEGELRAFLTEKIQSYGLEGRVKLFGYLPARQVLKGFDTFALPSLKEGLPYVLLEARVAGLPITANPVGGVREALDLPLDEFELSHMIKKTIALY